VLLLRQLPRAQPPCTCAQTPCRAVLATTSRYLHDDIWDKYSHGNGSSTYPPPHMTCMYPPPHTWEPDAHGIRAVSSTSGAPTSATTSRHSWFRNRRTTTPNACRKTVCRAWREQGQPRLPLCRAQVGLLLWYATPKLLPTLAPLPRSQLISPQCTLPDLRTPDPSLHPSQCPCSQHTP
jgi:hypothetical protein